MTDWRELWSAKDEDPWENTRIELHRIGSRGNWQFAMEDGPFSGYPAISLGRKDLEELYSALEKELYPERFMHGSTMVSETSGPSPD